MITVITHIMIWNTLGYTKRVFAHIQNTHFKFRNKIGARVPVRSQYNLTDVKYFDCVITYFLSIINIDKNCGIKYQLI